MRERAEVLSWREWEEQGQVRLGEVENYFQVENKLGNRGCKGRVETEWTRKEGNQHYFLKVIIQCCCKGLG